MEDLNFLQNMYITQSQRYGVEENSQVILKADKILPSPYSQISLNREDIFYGMIGRSAQMRQVFKSIKKVAENDSPTLITGSVGTGKELASQIIYNLSSRLEKKKITIDCAAEEGDSSCEEKLRMAHGGVLFLNQVEKLPLLFQDKILKILSSESFDIKVIASANFGIQSLVEAGKFKRELYDYLNRQSIHLPDLRERREDIPILILFFLFQSMQLRDDGSICFNEESIKILMNDDWPGNIAEMQSVIEKIAFARAGQIVRVEDLPLEMQKEQGQYDQVFRSDFCSSFPDEGVNLKEVLSCIETSLIMQALKATNGNKNRASKLLNINRTTLIEKIKKKNISLSLK